MEHPLTDKTKSPDDLKSMSMEELTRLASEIRDEIITTVSQNGGHLAPNLGIVELTIALHRVFHAPEDKIVWDVGHQSYPHKILTGRADAFSSIRKYDGLCGFTKRGESPYDCFGGGHAGVSISAAMGFSAAAEIQKKHELYTQFFNEKIKHSSKYYTLKNVYTEDMPYDVYVAGSDQIWNYMHTDYLDVYFLEFANRFKAKKSLMLLV